MNVESRLYRIGGHTVRVRLERPWTFKALTEQQLALVDRLRRGEDIGVESVPADRQEQLSVNEALMGKEAMTRETPWTRRSARNTATPWISSSTRRSRWRKGSPSSP